MRQFTIKKAKREAMPVLFGLIGPSGSGKTFSALRLATGIQRVMPGEIHVIDTEHRRSLRYADLFEFEHMDFEPPFSPLDYMAAIEQSVSAGAKTLIIDSISHSHEGVGGVLEWHDRVAREQAEKWKCSLEVVQFGAWAEPKAAVTKLKQKVIQLGCNVIFCYRAKEKIKPPNRKKGEREMTELGWMPIGDMELVYEFAANALLTPGCEGVPTWMPGRPGEQRFSKLPREFKQILNPNGKPVQLSEDLGEAMARWSAGDDPFGKLMARIESAGPDDMSALADEMRRIRANKSMPPAQHKQLVEALKRRAVDGKESTDSDADNDGRQS